MMPHLETEPLVTAGHIAYLLGRSTDQVRAMAKRGELDAAGAVFVGVHVMFDPVRFQAWRDSGGDRPKLESCGASGSVAAA